MQQDCEISVGDALEKFRKANGLDPAYATSPVWICRVGRVTLTLPNFGWRREAIMRHDLHHILTGYPCSMRGEFQMATWEFAAGRFPHPAATLFCLPLVVVGICWSPRAIWRAFLRGRRGRSLYRTETTCEFLQMPLSEIRADSAPMEKLTPCTSDIVAFCFLILQASLTVSLPAAAMTVALLFM